jgi:histidinol-phosphate aminotransferase
MSRFFSDKYKDLELYTPGEQPREQKYIKQNTNENPYPPLPEVAEAVWAESEKLYLYSDTECVELRKILAERLNVSAEELLMTNGSDEILNFAFMAFCDSKTPAVFADVTYGFYPVFADINMLPYEEIPLKEDLTIDITDYFGKNGTIFIANPNAPTAIALGRDEIEEIVKRNPGNIVVVDEAYVDFGAESCVPLVREYDNLLVAQTFSKSRSMAGARLGFGIGNPALIRDLNTLKYSTNPYNINRMTMAAGVGALSDEAYTRRNCLTIRENRAFAAAELEKLGFTVLPSLANFLFAKHPAIDGGELYRELKARGVLVRHFTKPSISDYNRITIGTREQMQILLDRIAEILEGRT